MSWCPNQSFDCIAPMQGRPCYATNRIYQPNICVDGWLDMKNKWFMSLYLKHYFDNWLPNMGSMSMNIQTTDLLLVNAISFYRENDICVVLKK
jgi:hypothetical protein